MNRTCGVWYAHHTIESGYRARPAREFEMKRQGNGLVVAVVTLLIGTCSAADQSLSVLEGPYLGQVLPGMRPKVFAPGFISRQETEFNAAFSPDGREFYYSVAQGGSEDIYVSQQVEGKWSRPKQAVFSGPFKDADPMFSPDGRRLYFISTRPLDPTKTRGKDWDIWYVEKTQNKWSSPQNRK